MFLVPQNSVPQSFKTPNIRKPTVYHSRQSGIGKQACHNPYRLYKRYEINRCCCLPIAVVCQLRSYASCLPRLPHLLRCSQPTPLNLYTTRLAVVDLWCSVLFILVALVLSCSFSPTMFSPLFCCRLRLRQQLRLLWRCWTNQRSHSCWQVGIRERHTRNAQNCWMVTCMLGEGM
jgi:hypothetical protein